MECIAFETYFASASFKPLLHKGSGNRETERNHSNWDTLQIAHYSGTRGKMRTTVLLAHFIKILSKT